MGVSFPATSPLPFIAECPVASPLCVDSTSPFTGSDVDSCFFPTNPFTFAFTAAVLLPPRGGLLTSVFSCVLLADAAVGLIIRSRKLPSAGAEVVGFLLVCEDLLSGLARDVRGVGRVDDVAGFGLEVVDCLLLGAEFVVEAGSCRAREAAVGAVSRDGRSIGFVASRFGIGGCAGFEFGLSWPAARATEAAVGAVKELRLAFFANCVGFVDVEADFGEGVAFAGDLTELDAGFAGALVETGVGLLVAGFFVSSTTASISFAAGTSSAVSFFCAFGSSSFLKSSATGGKALPPLTAASLLMSAGFISPGSSSAAVIGVSGFTGG